jgi:hypothetical protein
MKYAIINPLDQSVYSLHEAMGPGDLPPLPGAPYVVLANEDTAVGDHYDHDTATFSQAEAPANLPGQSAKAGKASSAESSKASDSGSSSRSR